MNWRKSTASLANTHCIEAANWRKATYSNSQGACIETASWDWRKASDSYSNGACIEVGSRTAVVGIRDSVLGSTSAVLVVSADTWNKFLSSIR